MGPESAKSYPGQQVVQIEPREPLPTGRAKQEIDYGRRGKAGYVFGALKPINGEVLTAPDTGRTIGNGTAFLERVEAWIPAEVERIYVVLDNLNVHRAWDVLLFNLAHPRWEFVFQPKYAASLNLIEPWWKTLRSLAFKGRRFETWEQMEEAVKQASGYWNVHKHPFVWGRRRRHRSRRKPGIARLPKVA
jgi:transposase